MKTYNDPAKALARDKLYEFIYNYLILGAGINPKKIKVGCLETAEAIEITEVYDRLKIPRANIVVIEQEPKIFQEIVNQNLGVRVVNFWDYEYFKTTQDGPFHVISLDYKSQKNPMIIYSVRNILGNNLLHYPGILMINNFAARENDDRKRLISAYNLLCSPFDHEAKTDSVWSDRFLSINEKDQLFQTLETKDLDYNSIRDDFTRIILYTFNSGLEGTSFLSEQYPGDPNFIYKQYPFSLEKELDIVNLARENQIEAMQAIYYLPLVHLANMTEYFAYLIQAVPDPHLRELAFVAYYEAYKNTPLVTQMERYKYVSGQGSPMHMDIFFLTGLPAKFRGQILRMFTSREGYNGEKLLKRSLKFDAKKYNRLAWQYWKIKTKTIHFTSSSLLPERIFLGSSTQMLKEENIQDASV